MSSIPRRPARPVSWVYSPGVRNSWRSPVNLDSFSITTERAGMLGGEPAFETLAPLRTPQHREISIAQRLRARVGNAANRGSFAGVGEPQAGSDALLDCLVAPRPAEAA